MASNNTISIEPSLKMKNRTIIKHQMNRTGANGFAKKEEKQNKIKTYKSKRAHASIKTHARALNQRSVEPYIVD